jgi:hypothetical protein
MSLPKFEEFSAEELAQLGQGEAADGDQEDIDLPNDLDEESDASGEEEAEEGEEEAEEGEEEDQEHEGEEEQADADAPVKKGKVDIGALHEERGKRKQIESNYQALQENFARLEQRTNMILQAMLGKGEQAPAEEEIPDKATDPVGYMEYLEKRLEKVETRGTEQQQQTQQQQQINEWVAAGTAMANEIRAKDPELYDASLTYVVEKRSAELRALGNIPEHKIAETINAEMTAGMINALKQKRNPGEFLLAYAKAGGYVHKPAPKVDPKTGKPVIDLKKTNEAIRKNKTLGQGGKRVDAAGDGLASKLASMNDAEFQEWYAKNSKNGKNKEFAKAFS